MQQKCFVETAVEFCSSLSSIKLCCIYQILLSFRHPFAIKDKKILVILTKGLGIYKKHPLNFKNTVFSYTFFPLNPFNTQQYWKSLILKINTGSKMQRALITVSVLSSINPEVEAISDEKPMLSYIICSLACQQYNDNISARTRRKQLKETRIS